MKKTVIFLSVLAFSLVFTGAVFAAGDKVRGEEGEGDTVQECVNFDECPYGMESPNR